MTGFDDPKLKKRLASMWAQVPQQQKEVLRFSGANEEERERERRKEKEAIKERREKEKVTQTEHEKQPIEQEEEGSSKEKLGTTEEGITSHQGIMESIHAERQPQQQEGGTTKRLEKDIKGAASECSLS